MAEVRANTSSCPICFDDSCFDLHKNFSTVVYPSAIKFVDSQLYRTLESRLGVANFSQPLYGPGYVMPTPSANFPFTFKYNPAYGYNQITLKREFGSEKIEIVASITNGWKNNTAMEEISSDAEIIDVDSSDDNDIRHDIEYLKKTSDEPWRLTVKVLKENGNALLFGVRAFEKEYEIDSMIVDKVGSEQTFKDPIWVGTLRSDVQEALRKYLDIRGLKEINCEFLGKYLQECVEREKLVLLREVKQFVEDIDATQSPLKKPKLFERVMPPPTPDNFPFTIEYDNQTVRNSITLKRKIGSQNIEIAASMPYDWKNNMSVLILEEDDNDKRFDEPWRLTVKVSRENGNALTIIINAYEKGYEIKSINYFSVGTSVQETLREYLDIIGLNEIDYVFLKKALRKFSEERSQELHQSCRSWFISP